MIAAWWLPTLFSALALGIYDVCKKAAVRDNSVMHVLFWATFSGSCFFLLSSAISGKLLYSLQCTPAEFFLVLLKSLLVSASWICVYYAMRELPISLASPIRSTSPLWTAVGGMIIFRESPTFFQAIGMVIILASYAAFSMIGKQEGFSWKSRGMVLIIIGTLLGAASALYDKYLLNTLQINREVLQMYFSIDLVAILGAACLIRKSVGKSHRFCWRWTIPATGILLIAADYIYFYALSLPDAPISMISLVRRCSCIVSFAVGVRIFHDHNVRRKALALLLLLTGVIILAKC